jgi:hypothetical protein
MHKLFTLSVSNAFAELVSGISSSLKKLMIFNATPEKRP